MFATRFISYGIGCALKNSHITSVALTAWEVINFGIVGEPGQECPWLARVYKITSAFSLQADQVLTVTPSVGVVMLGAEGHPLRVAHAAAHASIGGSTISGTPP